MEEYNDQRLLELLKKDNQHAFKEIYLRYWDKLFSVAANKLDKNLPLAEDVVQDIFISLWQRRYSLEITVSLSAYLATSVKYKVIDARQRIQRAKRLKTEQALRISDKDIGTEQQLSFEELKDRLAALVEKLPEKCKLVYMFSKENGYSQKQIAEHLNISEKTVESHLSRAIKLIRLGLKDLSHIFFQFFLF
ncbi:MAG: RNA polymerase sigma-70 factor [Chitinophagaceae bacterium]